MSASPLLDYALAAHAAGMNVWPPAQDGSKRPDTDSWKALQHRHVTKAELTGLYSDHHRTGIGAICGAISRGLALFEFDDRASALHAFETLIEDNGLGNLWRAITAGYWEHSPSGGLRTFIRCDDPGKSQKLALRPKHPDEMRHAKDKWQVLIETKAEGGYAIISPSFGSVHPTGLPYDLLGGGVDTIAHIDVEAWEDLCAVARMLDQAPKIEPRATAPVTATAREGRAGDDFNARGDGLALLKRHGWATVYEKHGVVYLRRPGKKHGISASFGHGGTRYFYPFTTSTDFEAERAYSLFAVFAKLEHGDDFSAAAKALVDLGYGTPPATIVRATHVLANQTSGLVVRRARLHVRHTPRLHAREVQHA